MNTRTKPLQIDARGISDMIDKLSRGIPPGKFLREFVKNAYDAHLRGKVSESNPGTITIAKDKEFPNKMVIANSPPGDPLTEQVALESLNAIFNPKSGARTNHGIGGKVAYLPQNVLGLLFRCRTEQISFTLHKDEENIYGLKTEIDENGEAYQIAFCSDEEFTFPDSETEVVLLGKTEEEDTWKSTLKIANPRKDSSHDRFAGYPVRNYLNECFWKSPVEHVDLKIAIYDKEGVFRKWARPRFLQSIKEAQKTNAGGCNGTVEHPDGAKIHYFAFKFEKGKKKPTHHGSTGGYIGYLHDDEVFLNKQSEDSERRRKMENAGVITHHKNVSIMIEFPEHVSLEPLLDRSAAVNEEGSRADDLIEKYTDYFAEHLPADLKEWMSNLFIHTKTDVVKEAAKFYRKQSSATLTAAPNSSGNNAAGGSNGGGTGNGNGGSCPGNNSNTKRRAAKSGKSTKHTGSPPQFGISPEGPTEPLVSFPLKAYIITVNCENPLFKELMDEFANDAPEETLQTCIAEAIYLNACAYHSKLIKSYPGESLHQLEERLSEDKLNALIIAIDQMAKDRISRRKAKSLKAQIVEEKEAA